MAALMNVSIPIANTQIVLSLGQIPVNFNPAAAANPLPGRFRDLTDVTLAPRLWAGLESGQADGEIAWSALRHSLRRFGSLPPTELAHAEVTYLIRVAYQLEANQLGASATHVIRRAIELTEQLKPTFAFDRFLEIAAFRSQRGDRWGALAALKAAHLRIEKIHYPSRPKYMGRLWSAQLQVEDPTANQTLEQLETRLGKILRTNSDRPKEYREFAQRLIAAGQLDAARMIIDKKFTLGYRVKPLADLVRHWAQRGNESHAEISGLIKECYVDFLWSVKIKGQEPAARDLVYLANQLLAAGPDYRQEAIEVCDRLYRFVGRDYQVEDRDDRGSKFTLLRDIATLFAKAQCFDEAYAIIKKEIQYPEPRSEALAALIGELAQAGHFAKARKLLNEERLRVGDRFTTLMRFARELSERGPDYAAEAKATLKEAKEVIQHFELASFFPGRSRRLADLGGQLAQAGDIHAAQQIYAKARESAETEDQFATERSRREKQTDLSLAEIASLAFPHMTAELPSLFRRLHAAQSPANISDLLSIAIVMGFRADGFDYGLEHLASLPMELQGLVKVGLYYGASLLPQDSSSRTDVVEGLVLSLQESYATADPHAARIHRMAAQGLERLDPDVLMKILTEAVRKDRPPDRLYYQSLFWIANQGDKQNRSFVAQLLWAPNFPERWRKALQRVLGRHGQRVFILSQ